MTSPPWRHTQNPSVWRNFMTLGTVYWLWASCCEAGPENSFFSSENNQIFSWFNRMFQKFRSSFAFIRWFSGDFLKKKLEIYTSYMTGNGDPHSGPGSWWKEQYAFPAPKPALPWLCFYHFCLHLLDEFCCIRQAEYLQCSSHCRFQFRILLFSRWEHWAADMIATFWCLARSIMRQVTSFQYSCSFQPGITVKFERSETVVIRRHNAVHCLQTVQTNRKNIHTSDSIKFTLNTL